MYPGGLRIDEEEEQAILEVLRRKRLFRYYGPSHGRNITYSADMCPRTLDLLSRAVHIDVSPDLTNTQVEEMTSAIHKVLRLAL